MLTKTSLIVYNTYAALFLCTDLHVSLPLCVAALNYENVVETGSETEEEDKLPVSEEDPLINGTGSPASLTNPEASPHAESHGLLTKEEEDDEMRDSGVEHIWPDNDMLSASVDGTGKHLMKLLFLNISLRSGSRQKKNTFSFCSICFTRYVGFR